MGVITVGIAMNAFVIALNQGMPYRVPEGVKPETTVKHRPEKPDDMLPQLGDYIVLGSPVDASISFGDLVIAVGLDRPHLPGQPPAAPVAVAGRDRSDDRRRRARPRRSTGSGARGIGADAVERVRPDSGRLAPSAPRDPLERVEHPRVVDVAGS